MHNAARMNVQYLWYFVQMLVLIYYVILELRPQATDVITANAYDPQRLNFMLPQANYALSRCFSSNCLSIPAAHARVHIFFYKHMTN